MRIKKFSRGDDSFLLSSTEQMSLSRNAIISPRMAVSRITVPRKRKNPFKELKYLAAVLVSYIPYPSTRATE